jgi:uncharacterized membrane protein YfcA
MCDAHRGDAVSASTPGKTFAISADHLGIWASGLCVVHCLLTPILLSFSAVFAHFLPSEEKTHRVLAIVITAVGASALIRGYRNHRRPHVLILLAIGLTFIFAGAFWGDVLPAHWVEVLVTFTGSGFMIAAHRLNHTFCRNCACSHEE